MVQDIQSPALGSSAGGSLGRLRQALQDSPARFDTRSLAEARSHLQMQDSSIGLNVRDPDTFRGYRELQLARLPFVVLSLGCIDAGTGYELSFQSRDELLVNIPLRGHGWVSMGGQSFEMRHGQILLVGPSCHVVKHWAGPGQVLGVHIPLALLETALTSPGAQGLPLYLPPLALIDHARLRALLGFLEMLVHDAQNARGEAIPFGGAAVAEHAERLLIALIVEGLQLAAPRSEAVGVTGAKPYYVRRAENYIRAHASSEMGIDALAEAAGVSPRTLQYGFRKVHGISPMLYLKRARLAQAREALQAAGQRPRKVAEIAADMGCSNTSQFSRDYRALYGESPSQTAAAPRRLVDVAHAIAP